MNHVTRDLAIMVREIRKRGHVRPSSGRSSECVYDGTVLVSRSSSGPDGSESFIGHFRNRHRLLYMKIRKEMRNR